MAKSDICEIPKTADTWQNIGVDRALSLKGAVRMRCPECLGAVRPHDHGKDGMEAHFEHLQGHAGCSLGNYFDGKKTPHPNPVK